MDAIIFGMYVRGYLCWKCQLNSVKINALIYTLLLRGPFLPEWCMITVLYLLEQPLLLRGPFIPECCMITVLYLLEQLYLLYTYKSWFEIKKVVCEIRVILGYRKSDMTSFIHS